MGGLRNHRDLEVWKAAVELATQIYAVTQGFPNAERFGLVDQMRRAAVSIASNIAEGAGRQTSKEFMHFLYIASGSASELDPQLEIAKLSGVGPPDSLRELQQERERISRMIHGLIRSLKNRTHTN